MREIILSLKRSPYQSLASFLVLFFVLFLFSALVLIISFFHSLLSYLETKPQVTIYFQTNTKEEDIFKIREQLVNSGKVATVKYISQQEALKIYREINKDNPLLLEMVNADILPASLEIYAKKPEFLPQIAEYLKKIPAADEVQYQKNIVERLVNLTSILRKISLAILIYLVLMLVMVLMTIFYFKIIQKKEEIELLQLLGAKKSYIIRPFLKEGLFLGIFSATMAFFSLLSIGLYFQPFLANYLRGIVKLELEGLSFRLIVWPVNYWFLGIVYILTLVFGLSITITAVYLAANRYLKE